jgi:hypothetical protein
MKLQIFIAHLQGGFQMEIKLENLLGCVTAASV